MKNRPALISVTCGRPAASSLTSMLNAPDAAGAMARTARRLAVLLHHLWVNGEVYDALYGAKMKQHAEARARAKAQARSKAA